MKLLTHGAGTIIGEVNRQIKQQSEQGWVPYRVDLSPGEYQQLRAELNLDENADELLTIPPRGIWFVVNGVNPRLAQLAAEEEVAVVDVHDVPPGKLVLQ